MIRADSEQSMTDGAKAPPSFRALRLYLMAGLLVLTALLSLCLVVEAGHRYNNHGTLALPSATWIPDPDLLYRFNPEGNEPGFRGKIPRSRQPGLSRIVCLGGSTTYGHALKPSDAWPAQVEDQLGDLGRNVEVLNAGVPGYGSRQLLARYRKQLRDLRPDWVLVYEGWNRTGALVDPEGWVPPSIPPRSGGIAQRAYLALLRHSSLLQSLAFKFDRGLQKPPWNFSLPLDPYHDVWVADMTTLVDEIKASGQRPVLIQMAGLLHPDMTAQEKAAYEPKLFHGRRLTPLMLTELERKQDAIRAIAWSRFIPLIDPERALRQLRGPERIALFMDEMHLTIRGNQAVAKLIAEELSRLM